MFIAVVDRKLILSRFLEGVQHQFSQWMNEWMEVNPWEWICHISTMLWWPSQQKNTVCCRKVAMQVRITFPFGKSVYDVQLWGSLESLSLCTGWIVCSVYNHLNTAAFLLSVPIHLAQTPFGSVMFQTQSPDTCYVFARPKVHGK